MRGFASKLFIPLIVIGSMAALGVCSARDDVDGVDGPSDAKTAITLPAGGRAERDVAYGSDSSQRLDVYFPKAGAAMAPIVLMAHGGGWMFGDKGASAVVANKLNYWVSKGYIFVSINYRMGTPPNPREQAEDVGRALAYVQGKASSWGGDASRVVLMGHSSGAHLVALLAADPGLATRQGAKSWLGTITLDSAALNVVEIMERRHYRFYDRVFGKEPSGWLEVSPYQRLSAAPRPMLLVCSSQRSDSCPASRQFAAKVESLGGRASVVPQDLKHGEINNELGRPGPYTAAVDDFLKTLGLP